MDRVVVLVHGHAGNRVVNVAHMFANAIARRIAYVLVALLLGWFGIGRAEAACTGGGSSWSCDTKPEAYDKVLYTGSDFCPVFGYPSATESATYSESGDTVSAAYKCDSTIVAGATASWVMECAAPELQFNPSSYECDTPCSERDEETQWLYDEEHPSVCHEGCSYDGAINVGGEGTGSASFVPNGGTCTVGPGNPAPVLDTDGDGVGDPDDAFPTDPGETTDSDGDGVGDNADTDPGDPTNGEDDGTGNESDNQASGGATCGSPPVCSGDAIACNTNFQIWKHRCEDWTTVTGAAEDCNGSFTCTGNPAECAKIKQLRVIACQGVVSPGMQNGDANENGVPDVLEGDGTGYTPGSTEGAISTDDGAAAWGSVDGGGWLGSGQGSCPGLPPLVLGSITRDLGEFPCDMGRWVYSFTIMLGMFFASVIIGRAAAGS